jgi:hypothetical protein
LHFAQLAFGCRRIAALEKGDCPRVCFLESNPALLVSHDDEPTMQRCERPLKRAASPRLRKLMALAERAFSFR